MSATERRAAQQRASHYNKLYPPGTHIPDPKGKGGSGEADVIHSHDLAPLIERFITHWNAERPNNNQSGRWNTAHNQGYMGPMAWLAQETGLNPRVILRIKSGEDRYVSLSKADALLQAMDCPERLDIDIAVFRNPRWSPERWHAYMAERGCV